MRLAHSEQLLSSFSRSPLWWRRKPPQFTRVDPPNWWVNYTPELTLLLTGENLSGAHVESASKSVSVLGSDASANGHYLFVHLTISASAARGRRPYG